MHTSDSRKNKNDKYWDHTSESYDPLTLLKPIQKNYCLRENISIAIQQCTIKSVQYVSSIYKTWLMNSIMSD